MNATKVDGLTDLRGVVRIAKAASLSITGNTPRIERAERAIAAVAELIERDKVAAQLFDCILRGLNDLSGPMGHRSEQFVAGWLEGWAKSMHAAGFKPTNPSAPDIARAIARIGGQP